MVTLDDLVTAYGLPAFCKVDVEGFEAEVLSGLSRPVAALSFEYLPPAHEAGLAALTQVERLGAGSALRVQLLPGRDHAVRRRPLARCRRPRAAARPIRPAGPLRRRVRPAETRRD